MLYLPLLWLSLAFLTGLVSARYVPLPVWGWAILMGLSGGLVLLESHHWQSARGFVRWRRICPLALGVVLAAFFSGGLRYQLAQPSFSAADLASYNDGARLRLVGLVEAPPDVRTLAGSTFRCSHNPA